MDRDRDIGDDSRLRVEKKIIVLLAAAFVILALRYAALCVQETQPGAAQDAAAYVSSSGIADGQPYSKLYPELKASSEDIPTSLVQDKKIVYLTFDDGPSEKTDEVLDVLGAAQIKATFFVIGRNLEDEDLARLKRIADEGHTIGIHTYSHDYKQIYSSVENYLADFAKMYNLIVDTTGYKPNIFRFPGGSNNRYISGIHDAIVAEMENRGFTFYDWTVSAEDAVGTPTKASVKKNLKNTFNHSYPIVLMHDASYNKITPSLLADFIDELKKAGYEFDTVDKRVPLQFK